MDAGATARPCWDEPPPNDLRSGRANLGGPWALGAGLDLELDLLAACQAVEIERGIEATAMEEVFLPILSGDEAETTIGDDLLDCAGGHEDLLC